MSAAKLLLLLAITTALPMAMFGTPILVSDGSVVFQQTLNSPCVIGNPSCNQGGFVDNEWPSTPSGSQQSTYDLFSPLYVVGTGSTISTPNVITAMFSIGIDVNYSTGFDVENLVFFKTWICDSTGSGCVLSGPNSYLGPPTGLAQHNGNGYSDAVLQGFSLTPGQYVKFEASVSNDTDGMEQFFLIPVEGGGGTQEVPEPATTALVGAGLLGLAYAFRRRRT